MARNRNDQVVADIIPDSRIVVIREEIAIANDRRNANNVCMLISIIRYRNIVFKERIVHAIASAIGVYTQVGCSAVVTVRC